MKLNQYPQERCLVKIVLSANCLTSGSVDSSRVNAEAKAIASINEALNLAAYRSFALDCERFETYRLTKLELIRHQHHRAPSCNKGRNQMARRDARKIALC